MGPCTSSPSSNSYYAFPLGLWEHIPARSKLLVTFSIRMDLEKGQRIPIIGLCWCVRRDIGLTIE